MKWFMAAVVSLALFLAMARSVVAPVITGPGGLEYLFLAPSRLELLLLVASAAAIALALRVWAIGVTRGRDAEARAREGRWMAPVCLVALAVAPLVVLIPGLGNIGAPFVFIGYDMQGWLLAVSVALLAREMNALSGGRLFAPFRRPAAWPSVSRLLAWDFVVFVTVIVWAIWTQPYMRFAPEPHGDEPKYLRYAENWYQGNGFDLHPKQRMSDMPLDAPSRVTRNVAIAARATIEEAGSLARDLKDFAGAPGSFTWNRAHGGDNWFLRGKQGGLYQAHTPGISAIIFPGYFVDRHLLDLGTGHQGEIPNGLYMTNVTLLLVYALWAVATFRLFRHIFASDRFAAGLAVLAMVTLPVTSFAFQLYPETFAGLALTCVLIFLLNPRAGGSLTSAFAIGLICGFLPWAHIRLSVLSLVTVLYALLPRAGEWRQRRAFLAGYAVMVALMCAYAYRLTGAPMPNAMFSAEGTADPFDAALIAPFFAGYMVDRIWGILPHVPLYLLAFLGLGPLWRANRGHALLFLGLFLSLAIPSAAHSLNAAGATPGRHLVAVIPLAMWPLGLAIREWWGSRTFRAAFATLVLISLQASLAYNLWHTKDTGRMWDISASGWKVNLLFAWTHGDVWNASTGNFVLFLIGAAVIVGLTVLGVARRGRAAQGFSPAASRISTSMLACGLVLTALAGTGAAALTGDAYREDYAQNPLVSRRLALARLAEIDDCAFCASSARGEVDESSMVWNDLQQFDVFVEPMPNLIAEFRVVATASKGEPAFGRVRIEFGDGGFSQDLPVAGLRKLTHVYRAPGRYKVRAFFTLPDETKRETYTEVVVQ